MTRSYLVFVLGRMARSLWFTPALYAALALGILAGAPFLAPILPEGLMARIGLSGVYDLLGVLASTLLAVSIFSLGILASSMVAASTVATPRVRPLLMQDRVAQSAISTFIGGFVYAILGIVGLSTSYYSDPSKTLLFLVTCVVILAVIAALIRWIGRLSRLGDVSEAIELVENAARAALADYAASPHYGGRPVQAPIEDGFAVFPTTLGYVQVIDVDDLGALAEEAGIDLYIASRPGAYVGPHRPLALASGPLSEEAAQRVRDLFVVGRQRTFEADPRFGLSVLSEIGSRALSPGTNDPGTAIGVITAAVRILADWNLMASEARPEVIHERLRVEPLAVGDLLEDAFRWIARDGAGQLEVQIWIQKALAALVAQDETVFGPAARALSQEALARAEEALRLPQDMDRLRALSLAGGPE